MMNNKKNLLAVALLCLSFQAAGEKIEALNSIAIEVNGNIITYGEIERAAAILSHSAPANTSPEQLLALAKNNLLERTLLVDTARREGFRATEHDINLEIERRATLGKTTVAGMFAQAKKLGLDEKQYRIEVAKDLLSNRVVARLRDDVIIKEGQIDAYIAESQRIGRALPNGEPYTVYQIRRILLNIGQNNTPSSVGKRMTQISESILKNGNLEELARRFSQEPAAAQGGVLEVTGYTQPAQVESFLGEMAINNISVPIQTTKNWQMFQLLAKRTETDPVKMQREAIRRILLQQEQAKAHEQFLGQLQHNMVVREYQAY